MTFLLLPGSLPCSGWRPSPGPEEAAGLQAAFLGQSGWTPQAQPHFTFPFWPHAECPALSVFSLRVGAQAWSPDSFLSPPSPGDQSYQG